MILTHPFVFDPSDTGPQLACSGPGSAGTNCTETPEGPRCFGSLDKGLIREVVRENIDEIRYCYERALMTSPSLAGKVAVKFIISPTGAVCASEVAQSTVDSAALAVCVAARVRTWTFPKPNGGGLLVVTYPFIFQPGERETSYETWSPHQPKRPPPTVPERLLRGPPFAPR